MTGVQIYLVVLNLVIITISSCFSSLFDNEINLRVKKVLHLNFHGELKMKHTLILISTILLLFSGAVFSDEISSEQSTSVTQSKQSCQELKDSGASDEVLAQRGCCSWHKGVCGCSGGRVTCCDGSTSPSCTCNQEDNLTDYLKL